MAPQPKLDKNTIFFADGDRRLHVGLLEIESFFFYHLLGRCARSTRTLFLLYTMCTVGTSTAPWVHNGDDCYPPLPQKMEHKLSFSPFKSRCTSTQKNTLDKRHIFHTVSPQLGFFDDTTILVPTAARYNDTAAARLSKPSSILTAMPTRLSTRSENLSKPFASPNPIPVSLALLVLLTLRLHAS